MNSGRQTWIDSISKILPGNNEEEARRLAQLELADRYVAAGKTKVANHKWASALASYNRALIIQRDALGQDNVVAGDTLHEIGKCLAQLGEKHGARTALNESLYIMLNHYGPEAEQTKAVKRVLLLLMEKDGQAHSMIPKRTETFNSSPQKMSKNSDGRTIDLDRNTQGSTVESSEWHYREFATGDQTPILPERRDKPIESTGRKKVQEGLDFHYKEFLGQTSVDGPSVLENKNDNEPASDGANEGTSSYGGGDESGISGFDNDLHDLEDKPQLLSEEEKAQRSADLLSAVDGIVESEEANIMSSLNSFKFGPEGKIELGTGSGDEKGDGLKAVQL